MTRQRILKLIHITSTGWFGLCAAYVLILALRQAGVRWWVILSLSGYSVVAAFLLLSLYLFALYRGAVRTQEPAVEHPLTSTSYYMAFYDLAPYLGGLAGIFGMMGITKFLDFTLGIALGTLAGTFLVWVIIDPALGLLEMLLPVSRNHRLERLAQAKAQRDLLQKQREQLLLELEHREKQEKLQWCEHFRESARALAALASLEETLPHEAERRAIDLGVKAWQTGGLNCMQQLHDMAVELLADRQLTPQPLDHISIWWDGVGAWRNVPLAEKGRLNHA